MDSIIYSILGWSFLIVAALAPILIIVKSIKSYRLVNQNLETFRFKAVAAICIWLFLTLGMFLIFGFLAYVISHAMSRDPSIKPHPTIGYVGLHLIYFAACYLLVDWMSRRRSIKLR
jgi:hypothetical protein